MKTFTKTSVSALALVVVVGLMSLASPAVAENTEPPKQVWPHKSFNGTYDRAALQRGFQVYKEVCSACHSMKFMSYRNLKDIGFSDDEVKAVAAQYTVTDGPNDQGEMFERPAKSSDRFKSPFANDQAARAANGGALPPDLSLVVKAREFGEDYIFALLTGFETAPASEEVPSGMYWNKYFPGNRLAMPPPLSEGQVTYADGTVASLDQEARDVTQFLAFASEPKLEARHAMGVKVMLFLAALAFVLYRTKRKIWAGLK